MATPASLIPELEDAICNGTDERRAEMLRRITNLFIDQASYYNEEHVGIFDQVLLRLIAEIETKTLIELAHRLSPVDNAPVQLMRRLANDDEIAIAGPVLTRSARLGEADLVDIASTKGPDHLLAISIRSNIGEAVTEVLVDRGDTEVARSVANNRSAKFSEVSFAKLVQRSERDSVLAEGVGLRSDVPPRLFRQLVAQAAEIVQQRLLAASPPAVQSEIKRILLEVSREVRASPACARDFRKAQQVALDMRRAGTLNEAQIARFARQNQFEEMGASLSALCAVPLAVVARFLVGDRVDPVLILCKSAAFDWTTARAIIQACPEPVSSRKLDDALANYERLSQTTAQRVVRFWQARRTDEDGPASGAT